MPWYVAGRKPELQMRRAAAAARVAHAGRQHDERRQIRVGGAEPVLNPRTERRGDPE